MSRQRMSTDYFQTSSGRYPVVDFMDDIDRGNAGAKDKCLTALDMLADGSLPTGRMEKVHGSPTIWELRVKHKGEEYRLFVGRSRDNCVVCNAFHKKSQKIPRRIINQAVANFNTCIGGTDNAT